MRAFQLLGADDGVELHRRFAGHPVHDLQLLGARRIADLHLQHEPVDLRLRQGIRALLLDGIFRRHDEERARQQERLVADGDLLLLHRFEQRALHLGGRAVDLVGKDQVREERPGLHGERLRLRLVDLRADQIGGQ